MPRIPYYDTDSATGKHAEFLGKLKPHINIMRMLANSEAGLKGFVRMGNALLFRCELDPVLRELAILRVGRLSRAAYEVFQHERIGREIERLACAERDDSCLDPRLLLEGRQQVLEEARLLGGGCRRDRDEALRQRARRASEREHETRQPHELRPQR